MLCRCAVPLSCVVLIAVNGCLSLLLTVVLIVLDSPLFVVEKNPTLPLRRGPREVSTMTLVSVLAVWARRVIVGAGTGLSRCMLVLVVTRLVLSVDLNTQFESCALPLTMIELLLLSDPSIELVVWLR